MLLTAQHNFSWITGGAASAVDLSREAGVATVLVAADGRRWLLANSIEMPRFVAGGEDGLESRGFVPVEHAWEAERADPELAVKRARELLGSGARLAARLAADIPLAGLPVLEEEIARARYRLTPEELARFRALGRDAGEALGEACRGLEPGLSEMEAAGRAAAALLRREAVPVVLLAGADDRIARFRHPVPTGLRWRRSVMIVVCARRAGLIVALTRIVWNGPVPDEIRRRTRAAAAVNASLLAATRLGAAGRDLFAVAARAYEEEGFPGEERLHHQGGACGYLSRDWIAHPLCGETVESPQGLAWNPSVTGTKVEETWVTIDGSVERITATPGWPDVEVEKDGRVFPSPDVASLENLR